MQLPQLSLAKAQLQILAVAGVVLFYLASIGGAYFIGRAHKGEAQQKAVTKELTREMGKRETYAKEDAAFAGKVGGAVALRDAQFEELLRRLEHEIQTNDGRLGCDLTPDELRLFGEIYEAGRASDVLPSGRDGASQ